MKTPAGFRGNVQLISKSMIIWIRRPENRGLRIFLVGVTMGFPGIGVAYITYQIYGIGAPGIFMYPAYTLVISGILLALIGGVLHLFLLFDKQTNSVEKRKR